MMARLMLRPHAHAEHWGCSERVTSTWSDGFFGEAAWVANRRLGLSLYLFFSPLFFFCFSAYFLVLCFIPIELNCSCSKLSLFA